MGPTKYWKTALLYRRARSWRFFFPKELVIDAKALITVTAGTLNGCRTLKMIRFLNWCAVVCGDDFLTSESSCERTQIRQRTVTGGRENARQGEMSSRHVRFISVQKVQCGIPN